MARDGWGVSATWSIWGATIYGALIGLPLQMVRSAITDDEPGSALSKNPEYLLGGLIVGAASFMFAALIRNRRVVSRCVSHSGQSLRCCSAPSHHALRPGKAARCGIGG
jgi:hypothetical protein